MMSQLDVFALRKHIVEFKLTRLMTLPPIIHFLNNMNDPEIFKGMAKLREILIGAAPLGAQIQLEFRDKLHKTVEKMGLNYRVKVVQIWGMTELSAAVIHSRGCVLILGTDIQFGS
jgi:acyl-coenzyme A synthetase/AMP-(fatty) acid ligase